MSLIVVILLLSLIAYSLDEQKARQDELDKIKKLVLDERTNTFAKAVARIKSLQKTEGKSKETIARQSKEADALLTALTEENKREGFDKYDLSGLSLSSGGASGQASAAGKTNATGTSAAPAASWYTKWYYWVGIVFLLLMITNVGWKRKESMTWRGIRGAGGFGKSTLGMIWSKMPGVGKRREKLSKAAKKYLEAVNAKEKKILEKSLLITSGMRYKEKVIILNINETNRLISLSKDLGEIVKSHLLALTDPENKKAVEVAGVGNIRPIIIIKCLDTLKVINDKIREDLNGLIEKLIELKVKNNTNAANIEQQVTRLKTWVEIPGIEVKFNNDSEILTKLKSVNTGLGIKLAEIKGKITEADKKMSELNGKITAEIVKISSKQDQLIEQERGGYKHVRELIEKKTGEYALAAQTLILNIAIALKDEFGKEDRKFYEEFKTTNTEINTLLTKVGTEVGEAIAASGKFLLLGNAAAGILAVRKILKEIPEDASGQKVIISKDFAEKIINNINMIKRISDEIEIDLQKEFYDVLRGLYIKHDSYIFRMEGVESNSISLGHEDSQNIVYGLRLQWPQLLDFERTIANYISDDNKKRQAALHWPKVNILYTKNRGEIMEYKIAFTHFILNPINNAKKVYPTIKLEDLKIELIGLKLKIDKNNVVITDVNGDEVEMENVT